MRTLLNVVGLLAFALVVAEARNGRDFSVFKVVRFPNGACESSNNRNGTCFTKQECEDKGGKEQGTCAEGYGVCCTFEIDECGKRSSQNNTYITNPSTVEAGECTTTICPAGEDICRLRVDFMTFSIAQPSTDNAAANAVVKPVGNPGTPVTPTGQCLEDSFRITCPGGPSPNVLCGTNTNQHMYVDAAENCNDLTFFIGPNANARMWNIKVSQIECTDYVNLPPQGCTQWFTEDKGTIQTYNFGGGNRHLANQNQNICFRKNKGMCGVCVINTGAANWDVSGAAAGAILDIATKAERCCGYGTAANGFDCLQVPGAANNAFAALANTDFCGQQKLSTADGGMNDKSICTKQLPLSVRFISDEGEAAGEGATGFMLSYELKSTC